MGLWQASLLSVMATAAAAPALAAEAVEAAAESSEGIMHTEVIQFFTPTLQLLEHLELDEFILLLMTIFPVTAGLMAALHQFTKRRGEQQADASRVLSAMVETEAALSQSASTVGRLEQQVTDLQRVHDARFADLHKDLAGIVWELSKLRADMARWQALAQLAARGSSRCSSANGVTPSRMAATPGAAHAGSSAPHVLPAPTALPPDTRPDAQAASEVDEAQTALARQEVAGARAWRGAGADLPREGP